MKITKRQLRKIIKEERNNLLKEFYSGDIEAYLRTNAAEYHRDPNLDSISIRMLLMDDFMDNIGQSEDIRDYQALIDKLASGEIMENKVKITKRQLRRIIRESLAEGGGIAMSPEELQAHGEPVFKPGMEGYHKLIDGDSAGNGISPSALRGGRVKEYEGEIKDIMSSNLNNPHMKLAYDIVFKGAAPGFLPFNFFNDLADEFARLGASKDLNDHLSYAMIVDDFEMNPPGW